MSKKIVKVPSMKRFRIYLRNANPPACSDSQRWLDYKNFKTVREMYESLLDIFYRRRSGGIGKDQGKCFSHFEVNCVCWVHPHGWIRWLLCDDPEMWDQWGGGIRIPPWSASRHAIKRLVDSKVRLDGTVIE